MVASYVSAALWFLVRRSGVKISGFGFRLISGLAWISLGFSLQIFYQRSDSIQEQKFPGLDSIYGRAFGKG